MQSCPRVRNANFRVLKLGFAFQRVLDGCERVWRFETDRPTATLLAIDPLGPVKPAARNRLVLILIVGTRTFPASHNLARFRGSIRMHLCLRLIHLPGLATAATLLRTANLGTSPGTLCAAPDFFWNDLDITKWFPLSERVKLRFDAQFFNVFNHPNFGLPSPVLAGVPGKGL